MSQEKKNKITIDNKEVKVKVKDLTFFDIQSVAPLLSSASLDFSSYWRYAFDNWMTFDCEINTELLSPSEGAELANMLPHPNEVVKWLLFREPKSAKSNISSTEGQLLTALDFSERGWNIS